MRTKMLVAAMGAAAATAAALSLPASATLKTHPLCDEREGQTVVASDKLRIFYEDVRDATVSGVRVYACAPGTRTEEVDLIAKYSNKGDFPLIEPASGQVRGRYVSIEYAERTSSGAVAKRVIRVYDVAAKRYLARYARAGATPIADFMTLTGGLAVLSGTRLMAFDSAGGRVLAAEGASEVTTSTTKIYWTQAGLPAAASTAGSPRGNLTDPA